MWPLPNVWEFGPDIAEFGLEIGVTVGIAY